MFRAIQIRGLAHRARLFRLVPLLAMLAFAAGCGDQTAGTNRGPAAGTGGQADGHEHAEDFPTTYAAAIDYIKEHDEEIREAFEGGNPEGAHEALHHVGDLLMNHMAELAEKAGMTEEQLSQVRQASQELFGQFSKLDDVFHNNATTAYSDVGGEIKTLVDRLESLGG